MEATQRIPCTPCNLKAFAPVICLAVLPAKPGNELFEDHMVLAQLEDVRNAQLYNVRCRVKGYLHGNGIAEQLPDAAVLAEVYARPVERRVDEGLPPSTAAQVLAEPLVQLVQCPFVALKDALW